MSYQFDKPRQNMDFRLNSPGQLALIAIIMWLLGVVIHPLAVLSPLGLILLLVAGAAYLLRPKTHSMYWRGRRIDLDEDRSAVRQLYHLLFRQ